MKKYTIIIALGVLVTLSACGSGSTTTETIDSTAVQVDTASVSATDTTVAQIPTENSDPKPETESK